MPLHPQAEAFLGQIEEQGLPPLHEMTVLEMRALTESFAELQGDAVEVESVQDILAPGAEGMLPVRIYDAAGGKKAPLLIYIHGGGWATGGLDACDKPCRELADAASCIVASIGYRLSPETKFPGPAEDCYAASKWLVENCAAFGADPGQVVIAGDSAGANLAAAVTLMARDRGGPSIQYQLLLYPVVAPEKDSPFASYADFADGFILTRAAMRAYWEYYLPSWEEAKDGYASPLLADDHSALPPALIVLSEFDPLHDEGQAYAEALQRAGVKADVKTYEGAVHGFFWLSGVMDQGRELSLELGRAVQGRFSELHA